MHRVTYTAAGAFGPVGPARVLDTRIGVGAAKAAVPGRAALAVRVTGVGGVPASGVSAVAVNLTVTRPAAGGYLAAYPNGKTRPAVSNLNFVKGQTAANLAVVPVGADGKIALYNASSGSVQLVADIAGYYRTGTPVVAGAFGPVGPARVLDTRIGVGAAKAAVPGRAALAVRVTGVGGVPASGVSAVAVNLTVTQTGRGWISGRLPERENPAGGVEPQLREGSDRRESGRRAGRRGRQGSPSTTPPADRFSSSPTSRATTEPARRWWPGRSGRWGRPGCWTPGSVWVRPRRRCPAARALAVRVTGVGGVPASGVSAVAVNLTVTRPAAGGYLAAYPNGKTRPAVSNLNFAKGQTAANLAVVPVGADGKIALYNASSGSVQLVADIAGYYRDSPG